MGPLLFSLEVMEFARSVRLYSSACLSIWYLDDGTFIGCSLNALSDTFTWTSFWMAFVTGFRETNLNYTLKVMR